MTPSDRQFLKRAKHVTEHHKARVERLYALWIEAYFAADAGGLKALLAMLDAAEQLDEAQTAQEQHAERLAKLNQQRLRDERLNQLCADANTLAGCDGANFWTQAGKVFEQKEKGYHESTTDSTTDSD